MPEISKSAEALLSHVAESARTELANSLRPILKKLSEVANELNAALGSPAAAAAKTGGRRGRPAAAATAAEKPAKAAKSAKGAKGTGKSGPRMKRATARGQGEALQTSIRELLGKGPQRLVDLTNETMKSAPFKGGNQKTHYVRIVNTVKRMNDVQKNAEGQYTLRK